MPNSEPTVHGKPGAAEGQWRGKAMVRNLKNGKNGFINLDILAREPAQMRMEVTATMGVHLASVALNGEEVAYILSREKKFVTGPADAGSLARLVPVRMSPKVLMAVLFDRDLDKSDWKCERDGLTKLVNECRYQEEDVTVRWLERKERSRRIKITTKDADVEMVIDQAKSETKLSGDTFVLAAPSGYKQEKL